MSQSSDVVIVGGGVIGGALAWSLAKLGASVTLVEAGRIGRGASWASAGVLSPDWSGEDPTALTTLAEDGMSLWPDWARELEERSGAGLNLRRDGLLNIWVEPDAPHLPADLATAPPAALRGEALSAAEVRALEPSLTGPIAGGMLYPGDFQVDNTRLAPALIRAAVDLGARVFTETPVAALMGTAGRCTGVRTIGGLTMGAGAVVLAAATD